MERRLKRNIFLTHVEDDGPFLKLSGQLRRLSGVMIDTLVTNENYESGIGAVPSGSIFIGLVCAAKPRDGSYRRAEVISTNHLSMGLVGVYYIDHGNSDLTSLSTLRLLEAYNPRLLEPPGQASHFYLSKIIQPSGGWAENLLMKLRSHLCSSNYSITVKATTLTLPIVSLEHLGKDLSTYLVANNLGIAVTVAHQERIIQLLLPNKDAPPMATNRQSKSRLQQIMSRSNYVQKAPSSIHKDTPGAYSFIKGNILDDSRKKDCKDECRGPQVGSEDIGQRGSSFCGRRDGANGSRRNPWECDAPISASEYRNCTPTHAQSSLRYNRDTDNKFNNQHAMESNGRPSGERQGRDCEGDRCQIQYNELPNPVPLETPFTEPCVDLNTQYIVCVSSVTSPDSFYVRIVSIQPNLNEMMHKIPQIYKGVKPYTGVIPVNSSILVRHPGNGLFYRATTLMFNEPLQNYVVQIIDFGEKVIVNRCNIWQLDKQFMELPKAVHCSLLGVAPKDCEWKENNEVDLCFRALAYQCVFQERVEDKYMVSLSCNGASVADLLIEKELAVASDLGSSVTLKGETIDLPVISSYRSETVESCEEVYLQQDLNELAVGCNEDTNLLTPLVADILADGIHSTVRLSENMICRAILNDVSDPSNIKAVLPDYGMSITTALNKVMILPQELSVYCYQALDCPNNYTEESKTLQSLKELKLWIMDKKLFANTNRLDGIRPVTTENETGQNSAISKPHGTTRLCKPHTRVVFNYNFGLALVSYVGSLNEIYLQKVADRDRIAALLDEMCQFYEKGTPEKLTNFGANAICAAHSSDGKWRRATVISATETECKLHYLDQGNTETIAKESLMKLDMRFYEPCALALMTDLDLVALQDDAISKLKEWTEEKEVQVTLSFGSDRWLSRLHLDGVDLSIKLVNEKLATPPTANNEKVTAAAPAEKYLSLPAGCTQAYISHIDSPGQFWLQMSDKIEAIKEIQAELQANAGNYADVKTREMGTLCTAKYSAGNQWRRAEIIDFDSDITVIRFLDYGNTDVLENQPGLLKEIIPDNLKVTEGYAVKCSMNALPTGTGQWSKPASDYFTQLVGDLSAPVDVTIVLKYVTTYVNMFVNRQNVIDKLISEGHATRSEETKCGGDLPSCFASYVNSPSEFWIRLETATAELQSIEAALVDADKFLELDEKEEGVICAAKCLEDGAWYRALIIVDDFEGTEVLFVDYGNVSIVTELRCLPDDLKVKSPLSRKCALKYPRDIKSWSQQSEVKFNKLCAKGATIFNVQFIASGELSVVELYLEGKSVTEELVCLC